MLVIFAVVVNAIILIEVCYTFEHSAVQLASQLIEIFAGQWSIFVDRQMVIMKADDDVGRSQLTKRGRLDSNAEASVQDLFYDQDHVNRKHN